MEGAKEGANLNFGAKDDLLGVCVPGSVWFAGGWVRWGGGFSLGVCLTRVLLAAGGWVRWGGVGFFTWYVLDACIACDVPLGVCFRHNVHSDYATLIVLYYLHTLNFYINSIHLYFYINSTHILLY